MNCFAMVLIIGNLYISEDIVQTLHAQMHKLMIKGHCLMLEHSLNDIIVCGI